MTKGFRYWFRCITVATLTALITFNPAWAGRGIRAIFGKRAAVCCETDPVANVCCPTVPADCCVPACEVGPSLVTDCCPAQPIVQECCEPSSSVIDNQQAPSEGDSWDSPAAPSAATESKPAETKPAETKPAETKPAETKPAETKPAETKPAETKPAETKPADSAPAPQNAIVPPVETSPSDNATETAPATTEESPALPAEPAEPAPAPAIDLPGVGDAEPAADNAPAVPDPFGAPAESEPAAPAGNDPFGAPAETEPAAPAGNDPFGAPTESEPAAPAGNDPFGAPAETEPATPAGNDPFGAPAEAEPADAEPAAPAGNDPFGALPTEETTPAVPAGEDPFGAAPAEDKSQLPAIDDLFETPAPESSENLFGEPDQTAPAASSLFGEPESEPEPEPASPAPTTDVEGLFGTPTEDNADEDQDEDKDAEAATSDETADPLGDLFSDPTSASPVGSGFDDLFGTPTVVEETQPEVTTAPASVDDLFKSTRTWHDNTGLFEVDAQLVVIFADSVRLLKENGKFCTLPIRRLSDHDKRFVEQVAQLLPGSDAKYVSAAK